jgi:GxxExxY protein
MDELSRLQREIYDISNLVYNNIGPGHNEKVYQKALLCELMCRRFVADSERHISVKYIDSLGQSHVLESERIDIYIHNNEIYNEGDIILELKATMKPIQETEKVQINKYFKELKKDNIFVPYGIVINFPQPSSKDTHKDIFFCVFKNNLIGT